MKTSPIILKSLLYFFVLFFKPIITHAQIVGSNAYMKGNYIEIGINGVGGFEGVDTTLSPLLSGMHFRSGTTLFGFVANPQTDGWANFDGDFFTTGTPENGWGIQIGNVSGAGGYSNNCNNPSNFGVPQIDIPGSITSWYHSGASTTTVWDGNDSISGLHFKIKYTLGDTDLFYITTILLTNNSSTPINNIYFYRNLDPDNNVSINGNYSTNNTIISQYGNCSGCMARVSATQTLPWNSYFEFLAIDTGYVSGFGGFSNRNGYNMYSGGSGLVQTIGSTQNVDEAIYLAYKIDSLPISGNISFRFASIFTPNAVLAAIAALQSPIINSDKEIEKTIKVSIYPNPITDKAVISISDNIVLNNASIHFYDVLGTKIKSIVIQSHEAILNKVDLSSGLYYYKLMNGGKQITAGKLIVN